MNELWLYRDAVQHLQDAFQVASAGPLLRRTKAAIDTALRDLPNRFKWAYYNRKTTFKLSAPQSSSTVSFDYTGGTHERQLTLTSGTWPAWARYGLVTIGETTYRVERRISDTVLTLPVDDNPGADLTAQSYTLLRSQYLLPTGFRTLTGLWEQDGHRPISVLSPEETQAQFASGLRSPGTPWAAAVLNAGDAPGRMMLEFTPPPDTALTIELGYESTAGRLSNYAFASGTVTTSGTTCTISTGTLPADLPGAYVRFSGSATAPTDKFGENPYVAQRRIVARTSATVFEIEEALEDDLTTVSYLVSDPIDVEPGAMMTAFLRLAEYEFSVMSQHKDIGLRTELMVGALRLAAEADQRTTYAGRTWWYYDPLDNGRIVDA